MGFRIPITGSLALLTLGLLLAAGTATSETNASTAVETAKPDAATVADLKLPMQMADQLSGQYAIRMLGSDEIAMRMTLFARDGRLFGRINDNDPTPMLYQGDNVFCPEDAPVFRLSFDLSANPADQVRIDSPDGIMIGLRIADAAAAGPASATSGPLFEKLAELDHRMFQAAFIDCDTETRNALFTEDVEFYHDRAGFEPASKVRAPITQCPAEHGMTRELIPGSLEVYPMADYGAIQMGRHRFFEQDSGQTTVARFTHLWKHEDGQWRIARVLSYDHQTEVPDSVAAAR